MSLNPRIDNLGGHFILSPFATASSVSTPNTISAIPRAKKPITFPNKKAPYTSEIIPSVKSKTSITDHNKLKKFLIIVVITS